MILRVLTDTLRPAYERRRRVGDLWHTRLFVPTGAYPRDDIRTIQASIESAPPEEDVGAICAFVECANRLLPDDAARERAGFKLQELQFLARSRFVGGRCECSVDVLRRKRWL